MNSLLPTIYLLALFTALFVIVLLLLTQILKKKDLERDLSDIQKKLRLGLATPLDI